MDRFAAAYVKEYGVLSAEQARERAGDDCKWSLLQRHRAGGCSGTKQERAVARSSRVASTVLAFYFLQRSRY